MPRPPVAKPGESTKTFIVKTGYIVHDNDGVERIGVGTLPNKQDIEGNDRIELTFAQATYFKNMGAIEVPLEEFGNEPADQDDTPKASDGDKAKPERKSALGKPRSLPAAKAEGDNNVNA